jgi:hypothetical protein
MDIFACLCSATLRPEKGALPVTELARALRALSLLVKRLSIEFEKIAALLSAKLTLVFLGTEKSSYGIQVNEGVTPILS